MSDPTSDTGELLPNNLDLRTRVPQLHDTVIFEGEPATVLRVHEPGRIGSPLDLGQFRGGKLVAFNQIHHDLALGWHWLDEPPPPDPTPEDRLNLFRAAGGVVPAIGSEVSLVRIRPQSFRGVEYVGLPARVELVQDVVFLDGWKGGDRQEYRLILALTLTADEGTLAPWEGSLVPGQTFGTVTGPVCVARHDRYTTPEEGWTSAKWPGRTVEVPQHHRNEFPCDRCGTPITSPRQFALYCEDPVRRVNLVTVDRKFARVCEACAEVIGRFVFTPPAAPLPVVAGLPRGGFLRR